MNDHLKQVLTQQTGKNGDTLLHLAASTGRLNIYEESFLIENINITNFQKETPLHWAAKHKTLGQLPLDAINKTNILQKDSSGYTAAGIAAENGGLKHVRTEVIEKIAQIPITTGTQDTILHIAAQRGDLHTLPQSVLTVSNMLIPNVTGTTPLYYASRAINRSSEMHLLLGLDFPISVRHIVGEDWWKKNEEIKLEKQELKPTEEDQTISLF